MVTQLHRSRKIFEGSFKPGCANHPHELLLIGMDLQGGVELLNDSFIPILPESQDLSLAHSFERSN
jgi:hypothetical protein